MNPLINNYGIVTYPMDYAVIYDHVIGAGTYMMMITPENYYSVGIYGPGPVGLYLMSSAKVLLLVLNTQEYGELRTGNITGSLFGYYGSLLNETIELPEGPYYIVVINNGSSTVQAELAVIQQYPTPLINAPIGIVDYGLMPAQMGYVPYSYVTNEFLGRVQMMNAKVEPLTNCSLLPPNIFSVQLNTVLELKTNNGMQYYWVQDVLLIDPQNETLAPLVNVWNMSSARMVMDPLYVVGHGLLINNETYAYMGNWTPFQMPLSINLSIITNRTINGFPEVLLGYSMDGVNFLIDNVTLLLSPSWGPYLVVNGSSYSPLGYLVDAELVIGGPGCGATVIARELNLSMSLYYRDRVGDLIPVPSAWSFGSDTGETVVNARDTVVSPGYVHITTGYEYLGPLVNSDYLAFLILNDYLVGNKSFVSVSLPLPIGSRALLTSLTEVYLDNNTLLRFAGLLVNNEYVNSTELSLTINQTYVVNYVWVRYYRLQVIDEANLLTNLSGWYNEDSIVSITVPRPVIYLGNDTRLVFAGFITNATHYVVTNDTLILLVDRPITVIINWSREYNASLSLYTVNGVYVTTKHLGWIMSSEELTNVSIGSATYTLRTPLLITGVSNTAVLNAKYGSLTVRDALGLPIPFVQVVIKCDDQEITGVTNAYGATQELLIPTNASCVVKAPPIGYYSIALILTFILLVVIIYYALHHSKAT
ncbi:thermopsin [Vulcanisaeta souniana]|uniref:thermopsin n=1 Tax=Vulcanisaeta souniana TaxID=164452 RepID=UPI001E55D302|nr:thermopsin [Vulcanisaeta souniana]